MRKLIVYTDGGAVGNPGPAAIGVVICNERKNVLKKYSEFLGENFTNNEAEYHALIFALKKIKQLFGKKLAKKMEIEVKSDSELMVRQLQGKYKILEEKLKNLFVEVWNLKQDFKSVKITTVKREQNQEADALVKEALKKREQKTIF